MNGLGGSSRLHRSDRGGPYSGFAPETAAAAARPAVLEFVGASGKTIAEAVRNALARASQSLTTLDGVGVVVIPQVYQESPTPRFRVTLRVTGTLPPATPHEHSPLDSSR